MKDLERQEAQKHKLVTHGWSVVFPRVEFIHMKRESRLYKCLIFFFNQRGLDESLLLLSKTEK